MATLIDGWKIPIAVCPSCLYDIKPLAIRHEGGWSVRRKCPCGKIEDDIAWPFVEGVAGVDLSDFRDIGFDVQIDERYAEYLQGLDDDYTNEVDHGWSNSYF